MTTSRTSCVQSDRRLVSHVGNVSHHATGSRTEITRTPGSQAGPCTSPASTTEPYLSEPVKPAFTTQLSNHASPLLPKLIQVSILAKWIDWLMKCLMSQAREGIQFLFHFQPTRVHSVTQTQASRWHTPETVQNISTVQGRTETTDSICLNASTRICLTRYPDDARPIARFPVAPGSSLWIRVSIDFNLNVCIHTPQCYIQNVHHWPLIGIANIKEG